MFGPTSATHDSLASWLSIKQKRLPRSHCMNMTGQESLGLVLAVQGHHRGKCTHHLLRQSKQVAPLQQNTNANGMQNCCKYGSKFMLCESDGDPHEQEPKRIRYCYQQPQRWGVCLVRSGCTCAFALRLTAHHLCFMLGPWEFHQGLLKDEPCRCGPTTGTRSSHSISRP